MSCKVLKNRTVVGDPHYALPAHLLWPDPAVQQSLSQKAEIVRVVSPSGPEMRSRRAWSDVGWAATICRRMSCGRKEEAPVGKYATHGSGCGRLYAYPPQAFQTLDAEVPTCSLDGSQSELHLRVAKVFAGLSGKLQAATLSMIAPDYKQQGQTVVPAELQYVEIISVTASSGYDANTGAPADEEEDKELPDTVTLLVSPEQAKVLAELEAEGTIHLALVYRGDERRKFLAAQMTFLELYPRNPSRESRRESRKPGLPLLPAKPRKQRRPRDPGGGLMLNLCRYFFAGQARRTPVSRRRSRAAGCWQGQRRCKTTVAVRLASIWLAPECGLLLCDRPPPCCLHLAWLGAAPSGHAAVCPEEVLVKNLVTHKRLGYLTMLRMEYTMGAGAESSTARVAPYA